MAKNLSSLFALRDLRTFPLAAMHVVMGMRLCILYGQAGRDPLPDLAVRLRSMDAARRIERIVRAVQCAWPEPFLIHRPCSMTLTPDETMIAQLAVAATQGNEAGAVTLLGDMLKRDVIDELFLGLVAAVGAIQSARFQPQREG